MTMQKEVRMHLRTQAEIDAEKVQPNQGNQIRPEDYMNACKVIHAELARIAEQTRIMAIARCADPSNPLCVSLMDRQDELLGKLAELDAQTWSF